ncbi:MAG: GAF domain-containing protein [Euryarchaeota archaeon]|nr:GAF domain-containing protein [Euryarchaeota archaeon]
MKKRSKHRLRILLIEDNPADADFIQELLEESTTHTFTVDVAETLSEGVKWCAEHAYDAVLLDLGLPDSQGLHTFTTLAAYTSDVPIIILTGLEDEVLALDLVRKGAQDYIAKDHVDRERVERAIRYAIERKQNDQALLAMQRQLEQQAQMLDRVLTSTNDVIFTSDEELRYTYINTAGAQLVGQPPDAIVGKTLSELDFPPGSTAQAEAHIRRVFETGVSETGDIEWRLPDGQTQYHEVTFSPMFDAQGGVQSVVSNARNVTRRKRAEAAQQEHARSIETLDRIIRMGNTATDLPSLLTSLLATLMQLMDFEIGGIALLNRTDRVAELQCASGMGSEALNRIQRIPIDEPLMEYVYERAEPLFADNYPEAVEQTRLSELNVRAGAWIPLVSKGSVIGNIGISSVRTHTFTDEEKELLTAVGREAGTVIARMQAEEELKRELSLNSALAQLYEPLISPASDIKETTLKILEQAKRVTGSRYGYVGLVDPTTKNMIVYSHSAMMTTGECAVTGDDKRLEFPLGADGRYSALWGHALNTNQPFYTNDPYSHETSIGTPKGHILLERYLNVPILIGDELVATIALANAPHDYTSKDVDAIKRIADMLSLAIVRLRSDEMLKRYSEHLGELVEERTRQLKDAERLAGIGETAAMIGHDLRNPLQGLQYIVDLQKLRLERTPVDQRGPREWEGLDVLLDRINEQIFYMDKIVGDLQDYARPMVLDRKVVPLRALIDDVLRSMPHIESAHVITDIPSLSLTADPYLMRRVFANLILNALQAMPDGGTLAITAAADNGAAVICVHDTGVGIPSELTEKLFSPLTTGKAKGTGLGLAVVKRIIDAHNGDIAFESTVGEGTLFTVRLPIK